jgi:2-phosphoglycerate kinase
VDHVLGTDTIEECVRPLPALHVSSATAYSAQIDLLTTRLLTAYDVQLEELDRGLDLTNDEFDFEEIDGSCSLFRCTTSCP